jgi:site-specific DNA-methyltransferase (adenine-specific)
MGKDWDHGIPGEAFWREALRVAKPGAHLLAFGGTRTFHRLTCAIEDAGWEIRDCLGWIYGSGFPKSKKAGLAMAAFLGEPIPDDPVAREGAAGRFGTALKPAWEPIILARKPLESTVAENVQKWGTGALNIDGCRVEGAKGVPASLSDAGSLGWRTGGDMSRKSEQNGRWPANLIHDGSEEVVGMFPQSNGQQGEVKGTEPSQAGVNCYGKYARGGSAAKPRSDSGSAARFFYCAKASKEDRGEGNKHPTVKPTDLMRYLCRLVTPLGGTVLDPVMGSGSTGKAAVLEGFSFIGIDNVPEYVEMARRRIEGTAPLFAEVKT